MRDYQILIEVILKCQEGLLSAKDGTTTYDEDSEADHADGVFCGKEVAYADVMRYCAEKLSKLRIIS